MGIGDLLRRVVERGLGVGELRLSVLDPFLAVVDGLPILGAHGGQAMLGLVLEQLLEVLLVRLNAAEILVAKGVEALGVGIGEARDHVVVDIECALAHHAVALEVARGGLRHAAVEVREDLGRVDHAHHGKAVAHERLAAARGGLLAELDGRSHRIVLCRLGIDGDLAARARHTAARELELRDLLRLRVHAHGIVGVADAHIFEIAELDGIGAGGLFDLSGIIFVDTHRSDDGNVGRGEISHVVLSGAPHVGAGNLEPHERERAEGDKRRDREEPRTRLFERQAYVAPEHLLGCLSHLCPPTTRYPRWPAGADLCRRSSRGRRACESRGRRWARSRSCA